MDIKQLHELAESIFTKRSSLLNLWQEQAENFYPQRADFTIRRELGTDFAGDLMSSYPLLCQRDLQEQLGAILRPSNIQWFRTALSHGETPDNESLRWMEWATEVQRRAMYDPQAQFNKSMKEGDGDYSCFGQTVTGIRLNSTRDRLLYRCYHLRDCAWIEDEDGRIGGVFRKWNGTARDLKRLFGDRVHHKVNDAIGNNHPLTEFKCMHLVVKVDLYDGTAAGRRKFDWWSIYYDVENQHLMEEVNTWNREYNIERWQTVAGSQYAFSPATVAALPEARLLQAMTMTLLEAGEKSANPPMVATKDAVRSDVSIYAGGITWVDRDYDERMGDALRAMNIDSKGLPFGAEQARDSRQMLMSCFYLNKLTLPQFDHAMTAYEVSQRMQEYIRQALPLFEPMETERNGQVCDLTFEILFRNGAFGPPDNMPKGLRGKDISFSFQSPLHEAIEANKGQKFLQMNQLIAAALQLDPTVAALLDAPKALRDVIHGIGAPSTWVHTEAEVDQAVRAQAEERQAQDMLGGMQQGSEIAKNLAQAGALPEAAAA